MVPFMVPLKKPVLRDFVDGMVSETIPFLYPAKLNLTEKQAFSPCRYSQNGKAVNAQN